jgi:predicted SnoaL-like aldol condensation-catalyzing enzyme
VAVHSHGVFSAGDRGIAVVDILRVERCKVVEHWDVVQPVPEKSVNSNGMF